MTYQFEYPEDSAMGAAERAIIGGTMTPENRAANVAAASRMANVGGPESNAAFLLKLHTYKLERGE